MVLPPPNVTGNLHVGHALTVVVEDSICRFNKLLGNYVCFFYFCYPIGMLGCIVEFFGKMNPSP